MFKPGDTVELTAAYWRVYGLPPTVRRLFVGPLYQARRQRRRHGAQRAAPLSAISRTKERKRMSCEQGIVIVEVCAWLFLARCMLALLVEMTR